jgi:hypothetical protein
MSSIKQRVPFTNVKQLLNKPNQKEIFKTRKRKEATAREIEKIQRMRDEYLQHLARTNGTLDHNFYQAFIDTITLLRNGTITVNEIRGFGVENN